MRNIFSKASDPNDFKTCPGDHYHALYSPRLSVSGTIELEVSDLIDIRKEINSHRSDVDMQIILDRLSMGDTSALEKRAPMYGDFVGFPSTYAEMYDLVSRSEDAFAALDPAVKSQFNNSVTEWFAGIGSVDWLKKMGLFEEPISVSVDSVEEGVVSE